MHNFQQVIYGTRRRSVRQCLFLELHIGGDASRTTSLGRVVRAFPISLLGFASLNMYYATYARMKPPW